MITNTGKNEEIGEIFLTKTPSYRPLAVHVVGVVAHGCAGPWSTTHGHYLWTVSTESVFIATAPARMLDNKA